MKKTVRTFLFVFLVIIFISGLTQAAIVTKNVMYQDGKTVLNGFLAYDDNSTEKRPGVLIFHEWMGINDYIKRRAVEVARLGYVVFAADVYGANVRPANVTEAATVSMMYRNNRPLMRTRARAGLKVLQDLPLVDINRIAAMGYCFGGTCALELARSGAPLKGVVSFHGVLDTPDPTLAKNIKGKVLVLHGAADPYAPAKQVAGFRKEMTDAGIDYRIVLYPGAVHAFTNPDAGNDPTKGAAYNRSADLKSWDEMAAFFKSIFK
jgi:dienelactone hydrolase